MSVLIGRDDPLDQYFMHHPQSFFGKGFEHVLINQANPYILKSHLLCAAWEHPLGDEDGKFFGAGFARARAELEEQGLLRVRHGRWYPSPRISYPAREVNIRTTSPDRFTIIDASPGYRELETVESAVALFQIHPGAIYLHQGEAYLITELDLSARIAYAMPTDAPYYTQAKDITEVRVIQVNQEKRVGGVKVYLGQVEVTTTVVGFRKKRQFTEEVIAEEPLDLPSQPFTTIAFWFDILEEAISQLAAKRLDFAGGLHATEHAAIALLPLFALCDRSDIGGLSTPVHVDTGRPQIFIYDAYPGGIGIAEKGFELVTELWRATLRTISECPCEAGCPSCVQSPKCGNNNEPLDKKAAELILHCFLGQVC